jgi:hypothetical protein
MILSEKKINIYSSSVLARTPRTQKTGGDEN